MALMAFASRFSRHLLERGSFQCRPEYLIGTLSRMVGHKTHAYLDIGTLIALLP